LNSSDVQGLNVLITRPAHQSHAFIQTLSDLGASVSHLPTIEIEYLHPDITSALKSDMLIFTSINAVQAAVAAHPIPWNYRGKIAAVGPATAKELESHNIQIDIQPSNGAGSEALLEEMDNLKIENLKITIVRGDTGRDKLNQALTLCQAKVSYLAVYRRAKPEYSESHLYKKLVKPDIVTVTSDLGLQNLIELTPADLKPTLFAAHLITNSDRCSTLAKSLGFHARVLTANPPGDDGQLAQIRRCAKAMQQCIENGSNSPSL